MLDIINKRRWFQLIDTSSTLNMNQCYSFYLSNLPHLLRLVQWSDDSQRSGWLRVKFRSGFTLGFSSR